MMLKKTALLALATLAIPHQQMRAELSDGGALALAAGITAAAGLGVYAIGQKREWWGNPDPYVVLSQSQTALDDLKPHEPYLHAFEAVEHSHNMRDHEEFLYRLCTQNRSCYCIRYAHKILLGLNDCLTYMQHSRYYKNEAALRAQLQAIKVELDRYIHCIERLNKYITKHKAYRLLFDQEKEIRNDYAQEYSLYTSYAYQPAYLKSQLYAIAACKHNGSYAMIYYIKTLSSDISELQTSISNAPMYSVRVSYAQEQLNMLLYIHNLITSDPAYQSLLHQYDRYKAEQERLRIERDRLEFERLQARLERAALQRERERAELARIQAQREREKVYYPLYRPAKVATEVAVYVDGCCDGATNGAIKDKREAQRAQKEAQQQRAQAQAAQKDAERQRQESERLKKEADLQRQEAERLKQEQQQARERDARISRRAQEREQREQEEAADKRERERKEEERKKRKRAQEKALAEAEAKKATQDRYDYLQGTFDQAL